MQNIAERNRNNKNLRNKGQNKKVHTMSCRYLRSRKRKWEEVTFENIKTQDVPIINEKYESADSGKTNLRYANKITIFNQI